MFKDLSFILSKRDKIYFLILLILSIVVSVIETFSISMIMPFFSIVANIKLLETNNILKKLYTWSHIKSPLSFLFLAGVALILLMIFRAIMNTGFNYLQIKFTRTRLRGLANRLFKRYLDLTYLDFSKESSANLTQNIILEATNVSSYILGIIIIFSEVLMILLIYTILMFINWQIALTMTFILAIMGLSITAVASKVSKNAGERRLFGQNQLLRTIQETFGNYRFIKFLGEKGFVVDRFFHASSIFIRSDAISAILAVLPKIIMETVGIIILLSILLFAVYSYHDPLQAIPILMMYAVAFFRLMPSINRIMNAWFQAIYFNVSYKKIVQELKRPIENLGEKQISFTQEISLNNIYFSYSNEKPVLINFSIKIPKGNIIAFWGPNGSGKSTAMDILSGLLSPQEGNVSVDGNIIDATNVQSWRRKIGYIPQQLYLFEGTVEENILCGREYVIEKYQKACNLSGVAEFVAFEESKTLWVGENGNQLSGGQKQRVAVARALYDNPEVILLDEATSALDKISGKEILSQIFNNLKGKTMILVTHNEDFLQFCNQVIKF